MTLKREDVGPEEETVKSGGWILAGYVAGVLALGFFWWLQHIGLLADTPYPVLVGLLALSSGSDAVLTMWQKRAPDCVLRAQIRFAVTATTTSMVLYAVGWGSLFVIGYAVGAATVLAQSPSRKWPLGLLWNVVTIVLGQVAIQLDIAPSLVDKDLSHAMAVVGVVCLGLVMWILGTTLAAREAAEARLAAQAATDTLTGLRNRRAFTDALTATCGRATPVVVAFVDLDDFKQVNDTFGHEAGDEVLVEVGARLRRVVREEDVVARFGGDEFVVLVAGDAGPKLACLLAGRIRGVLAEPWPQIAPLTLDASVGVVVDEDGTRSPEDLLRDADQQMYTRKRNRELERLGLESLTSS
jgi:diguanylate cyclase (GGDEF)-like protein